MNRVEITPRIDNHYDGTRRTGKRQGSLNIRQTRVDDGQESTGTSITRVAVGTAEEVIQALTDKIKEHEAHYKAQGFKVTVNKLVCQ